MMVKHAVEFESCLLLEQERGHAMVDLLGVND
jgi:hypothetical protein